MSRKSRWRFLCIEQLSQYHLGLWSEDGDRRSYERPKKSFPSESFTNGPRSVSHPSHRPTDTGFVSMRPLQKRIQILHHRFHGCPAGPSSIMPVAELTSRRTSGYNE